MLDRSGKDSYQGRCGKVSEVGDKAYVYGLVDADAARALLGCEALSKRQHRGGATLTSTWFSIEKHHK